MAEQWTQRGVIWAELGGTAFSHLRKDTTPKEAPGWVFRGDVIPTDPHPGAHWYRSTQSSGSGAGEWYYYDHPRAAWLSVESEVFEFYHDAMGGLTIPNTAGGGLPLKMTAGGVTVTSSWGYPLAKDMVLVATEFSHDTVNESSFFCLLPINGVLGSGPPVQGGIVPMGLNPGRNHFDFNNTNYLASSGAHIGAWLVITSGTGVVTSGQNVLVRATFRRRILIP